MRSSPIRRLVPVLATTAMLVACDSDRPTRALPLPNDGAAGVIPEQRNAAALAAVMEGNAQAILAVPSLVPPGAPVAPPVESRLHAIVNVAMHDALNAITPRHARYADTGARAGDAYPAAAVLTAAHDAIVGAAPGATAAVDAWYAARMAELGRRRNVSEGVAVGARAAAAILARRTNDGTAGGGIAPYTPGSAIGDYQFTFPFNTPGFDFFGTGGFADGSVWGVSVQPFVILSTSQFRAPPPYGAADNTAAVQTAAYTHDFHEVAALGCAACAARTADQTEIALFWLENSPSGWNRIARTLAGHAALDAWEAARLFALLHIGEFDALATSLESKYHYNFWRPVTAIAQAATDGNPATQPVAGWDVLGFPTPPIPDYPSGHSTAGAVAATVIDQVMGTRAGGFSMTSASLPGVTRHYDSVAAAARENADSRVYVGFHFRHATDVGYEQGRRVGMWVARALR